ncbi:hypothetical protein ACG3SL_11945 [Sphingomonas sp. CJ20]
MKKILFFVAMLIAGLAVGGGAAFATSMFYGKKGAAAEKPVEPDPAFVDAGQILAPLVFPDGRLAGYVQIQMQLQVPPDKVGFVTARLPLMLHAINMRTYRTPMAAGPDGMIVNIEMFRKVAMAAAPEAFGAGVVRRVAVTAATPA